MAKSPEQSLSFIGFGLDRVGLAALRHPVLSRIVMAVVGFVAVYGLFHVAIDQDLRSTFRGDTEIYQTYEEALENYADPENQVLVLVEGDGIGDPDTFARLFDLHLELSLLDDVANVFSLFSLRTPPDEDLTTRPLIADAGDGLNPELIDAIRTHPILGARLLSEDGTALILVVTHAEPQASPEAHQDLMRAIDEVVASSLRDSGVQVTVAGFAAMRAEIVRLLRRDQIVINGSGIIIGFLLCLILFRSLFGAAITAVPAAFAGITLLGWSGALGIGITTLSNVIPGLVMVLGFADGMHLTSAWRRFRQEGHSVLEAERLALVEVAPACMLSALTTAVAFLSLVFSDVEIISDFGRMGAVGTVVGTGIVLVMHVMMVRLNGRFWRTDGVTPLSLLNRLAGPVSALTSWVVARQRSVAAIAVLVTLPLGAGFLAVAPENSVSEMLPADSSMVQALRVVDSELGGVYPVQIIVPMDDVAVDSLEGLERIRAVHDAVAGLGASQPESLWSLVQWAGGDAAGALALLAELPAETRQAFIAQAGALVTINLNDMPTADLAGAIDRIESAALAAVPGTVVTGAAVVGAREATRTIRSLTVNLGFAVVVAMTLIAVAFRSIPAGLAAVIPNVFPVLATGTVIYLMGDGMQIASIVSLTIAFGIAIDDTVHYLSALFLTRGADLRTRMIAASRRVGPVLVATTVALIGGMLMTQTSGLATVVLFGQLAMGAFIAALIGDLVFLPALIAGPLRRLFSPHTRGVVGAGVPEPE